METDENQGKALSNPFSSHPERKSQANQERVEPSNDVKEAGSFLGEVTKAKGQQIPDLQEEGNQGVEANNDFEGLQSNGALPVGEEVSRADYDHGEDDEVEDVKEEPEIERLLDVDIPFGLHQLPDGGLLEQLSPVHFALGKT